MYEYYSIVNYTVMNSEYVSSSLMKLCFKLISPWLNKKGKKGLRRKKKVGTS